jgi:hypothetical protein
MRLITLLCLLSFLPLFSSEKYLVKVPVADLRLKPISSDQSGSHDPLQDSQALLGDFVETTEDEVKEVDGFIKVKVLNQKTISGVLVDWIEKKSLQKVDVFPTYNLSVVVPWTNMYVSVPMGKENMQGYLMPASLGTYLEGIEKTGDVWKVRLPDGKIANALIRDVELLKEKSTDEIRYGVLENGLKLLGNPYYWGGASAYRGDDWFGPHTGVDCSGLVYLLYKSQGIQVPRDANPQYEFSCKTNSLKPADLVFLARKDGGKVHHVMIYVGDDQLLEAHQTGSTVRLVSFEARIGLPLHKITSGQTIGDSIVYFGSLIKQ